MNRITSHLYIYLPHNIFPKSNAVLEYFDNICSKLYQGEGRCFFSALNALEIIRFPSVRVCV